MITEREAVDMSIEMWEKLATDSVITKGEICRDKGWMLINNCPLCEFTFDVQTGCPNCPYIKTFGYRCNADDKPFLLWANSETGTKQRKIYAREFLAQLYYISRTMPEPKWADVTEQCDVSIVGGMGNYLILFKHHGVSLGFLGANGGFYSREWVRDDYKGEGSAKYFRIYKREG